MEISRRPFFSPFFCCKQGLSPWTAAFTIFSYFHLLPAPRSVELSSLTPVVSAPGDATPGAKRPTAGFEPWICLEGCTLVARTDQQLLVPTIDVVEVGFGRGEDGFEGWIEVSSCSWPVYIDDIYHYISLNLYIYIYIHTYIYIHVRVHMCIKMCSPPDFMPVWFHTWSVLPWRGHRIELQQ